MNTPTNNKSFFVTRSCAALLLAGVVLFSVLAVFGSPATAATKSDEACRDWYESQVPDEQVREDNEAQLDQDVDKDGCTGMFAAPGSDGPVDGALKEGGTPEKSGSGGDPGDGSGKDAANDSKDPGTGDTGSKDEGSKDCAEQYATDSKKEQMREREEDRGFNLDNDKDGCIAEQPADGSTGADGSPPKDPQGSGVPEASDDTGDDGGLNGMGMSLFKNIMNGIWDWTFGWALEEMGSAFKTDLLSLPTFDGGGDLMGIYTGAVEKLRPAILVGILVLGILMMVRSDNYDLAYAGFQGLPRLMGIAIALAFLPQFMGELSRITAGITQAFFPGGQQIDAAGQELFKAAVGNLAVTNFLNLLLLAGAGWVGTLLVIAALLNKILYNVLFVAGAFALTASIVPSLYSLAGSWFRGVLACAAIPALWSIELGVGSIVVTSPKSIFGGMTDALGFVSESAVTSLGAIITMWVMYKTPFKCIEWAFNVHLPGRGGLMALAKTGAALAVAIPAKTAIATATRGLMNRSTGSGGSAPRPPAGSPAKDLSSKEKSGSGSANARMPGKKSSGGSGEAARKIQQARTQGQRGRAGENLSKAHFKYNRQRDRTQESKEQFMQQGGRRGTSGAGMKDRNAGDKLRNRS